MPAQLSVPTLVVIAVVIVATITDMRTLKVHNILTLPLLACGLIYHWMSGGFDGLTGAFSGALWGFALLLVPYMLGGMGAGDVKLVAAIGAWLGSGPLMAVLAVGLLATAIYSLGMLFVQGRIGDAWHTMKLAAFRCRCAVSASPAGGDYERVHDMAKTAEGRRRLIPFSAMVGVGLLATLTWSAFQTGPI
jgi:prepilin peptidase CpaA